MKIISGFLYCFNYFSPICGVFLASLKSNMAAVARSRCNSTSRDVIATLILFYTFFFISVTKIMRADIRN